MSEQKKKVVDDPSEEFWKFAQEYADKALWHIGAYLSHLREAWELHKQGKEIDYKEENARLGEI